MNFLGKNQLNINRETAVVVLTGAGISAESGVPIFRGKGSMWDMPKARALAKNAGPPWNTKGTWEFYEWRRKLVAKCEPNLAHATITEMEKFFETFHLITQNVDGLHERAGTKTILELHGNMWEGKCPKDGEIVKLPNTPLKQIPPYHSCGTALAPHIVQFGQPVEHINKSFKVSANSDLFFLIGTSGVVSPARDMPLVALKDGAFVIEINPETTILTSEVSLYIRGKAAVVLPELWKELLSSCKTKGKGEKIN